MTYKNFDTTLEQITILTRKLHINSWNTGKASAPAVGIKSGRVALRPLMRRSDHS